MTLLLKTGVSITLLAAVYGLLLLAPTASGAPTSSNAYEPPEGLCRALLAVSSDFRYLSSLT